MKKTAAILLALLCLHATSALALEGPKPYIGAGISLLPDYYYSPTSTSTTSSTSDNTKYDRGFKVYTGVEWGFVGVELGYYDFGSYDISTTNWAYQTFNRQGANAAALSVIFNLPVADKTYVTARYGRASLTSTYYCDTVCGGPSRISTDSMVPIAGVGLRYSEKGIGTVQLDVEWTDKYPMKYGQHTDTSFDILISVSGKLHF
jgi:hypothetical protein